VNLIRTWPEFRLKAENGAAGALITMDRCLHFMAMKEYESPNPAVAVARTPIVAGLWIMLWLAAVILVWGALAPIDSAVVARGSVVLSSNRKTVQHLEGGIVNEIFVKEGDKVVAGQKLLTLTNSAADTSRDTLREQLFDMRASEARLGAIRDGLDTIAFDDEITEASKANPVVAKIVATQNSLFGSEKEAEQAKVSAFNQRIAQFNADISGAQAQNDSAEAQLKLVEKEIAMVQDLLKSGYETKPHLYALQKSQSELIGNRGQFLAQISKAQQSIGETETAITNQKKEFETKNEQELRETQAKVADLGDKLRASEDVVGRTTVTAPAGGIVMGLKYHTPGGVVAAGAPIMEIVPQDDPLVVDVRVNPTDINSVHIGMDANVMFAAYKARTTPKVPAKVTQVSADIFTEERSNSSYYVARLEVDKNFISRLKKPIELYPGSPVNVFLRTGSRSFLSYLFKPITDGTQSAFREL
jgi:HlyD family type I secretion membrane fusion protein